MRLFSMVLFAAAAVGIVRGPREEEEELAAKESDDSGSVVVAAAADVDNGGSSDESVDVDVDAFRVLAEPRLDATAASNVVVDAADVAAGAVNETSLLFPGASTAAAAAAGAADI